MPDFEEMIRFLNAVLAAGEKERAANSDEARAAAQAEHLAARDALLDATGTTDLERRRMIAEARGLPLGAKVDATGFEHFARECLDGTPSNEIRLRHAFGRHTQDAAGALTRGWAGVLVSQMLQNAKGHKGPLDGPVRARGVDPYGGPAYEIQNKIVVDTGYTIGVEIGVTGRIPHELWKRAERAQNALAQTGRMRGHKTQNVSFRTIKDWCLKSGSLADLFKDARREGSQERPAPDLSRILLHWVSLTGSPRSPAAARYTVPKKSR
jgi:hypothetical protein